MESIPNYGFQQACDEIDEIVFGITLLSYVVKGKVGRDFVRPSEKVKFQCLSRKGGWP